MKRLQWLTACVLLLILMVGIARLGISLSGEGTTASLLVGIALCALASAGLIKLEPRPIEQRPLARRERLALTPDRPPVIVFATDDPLPLAFTRIDLAARYIEAADIEEDGYDAIYTVDGRVVEVEVLGVRIDLRITASDGIGELRRRLSEHSHCYGPSPSDPVAFANAQFREAWERRWPRRPAWLSRRVHGDRLPQI